MILKIFTKKKPGGELVENAIRWKEEFIEADVVKLSPTVSGYEYHCYSDGKEGIFGSSAGAFSTDTQGYELIDKHGNVIDRFVTPIKED